MSIFEKVNEIFEKEDEVPRWAKQLFSEINEIKELLKNNRSNYNSSAEFRDFVKTLRLSMKADIEQNIYPQIEYENKNLGINFKGLLYDKSSLKLLSTDEAFKVYKFLFENK